MKVRGYKNFLSIQTVMNILPTVMNESLSLLRRENRKELHKPILLLALIQEIGEGRSKLPA